MQDLPFAFLRAAREIHVYLHRDARYTWRYIGKSNTHPLGLPCVVACAQPQSGAGIPTPDETTRSLAFAKYFPDGVKRWFGMSMAGQDVVELRDIAFFMQVFNEHGLIDPARVLQPSLAQRVNALRLGKGQTIAALARTVGRSASAISQIESGHTKQLQEETLYPLAKALGVSARWLTTGTDDNE